MSRSRAPDNRLNITRAQLLHGGAAMVVSSMLGASSSALAGATGAPSRPASEVAAGVFVHQGAHALASAGNGGDIGNAAFVIGSDAVAVIDTGGSAKVGQALREAIRARTDRPIRFVVNTHMHPDHVLGNVAFEAEGVAFVAHHKLLRALAERSETYLEAAKEQLGEDGFAGTKIVLPTEGVTDQQTLDLGGRTLTLKARPTAHTNNDLTIHDSGSDTLFLGDLLFSGHLPTIDGSLRGWLKLLDLLETEPAARVVPGHGPASMAWPGGDADIKRYLNVLAKDVRADIAAGRTMTQSMQTAGQSEAGKWQLFSEHHARNVSAAFAELEWE